MIRKHNSLSEKAVEILGGLRLSFVLLILLGLLLGQRAIIAQKAVSPEDAPWLLKALNAIGLDSASDLDIPFLIILGLFLVNLALSSLRMARQVRVRQERARESRGADAIRSLPNHIDFEAGENPEQRIVSLLRNRGFRPAKTVKDDETLYYFGRRMGGLWGVLFFHLTFFIVLVGALLSFLTRYTGYIELTPGETFVEKEGNYLRYMDRPRILGNDRLFMVRLDGIDLSYWKPGEIKQRASIVSLVDAEGRNMGQKRVEVNSPLSINGMKVYQGPVHGFKAWLDVTDEEGTTAWGTARFRIPQKPDEKMTSLVRLPGTSLNLGMELFTDRVGKMEGLEPLALRHKATLLKVHVIEQSRLLSQGVVFEGGTLSFEGLTLKFRELKPYTSFLITQDYGVPVIFSGFVFLIFGLLVTYFWVPESFWVSIKEAGAGWSVVVGASTERYKDSFRERFLVMAAELESEVGTA